MDLGAYAQIDDLSHDAFDCTYCDIYARIK